MLAKNTASQYAVIYVHDTLSDIPKTGYAASLTGYISKDGAAFAATDDVAPTELAYGFYQFTLLQAETNANEIIVTAVPADTQFAVQAFKYTTDNGLKAETVLILADTGTTLDDHLTDIKGTGFVKDTDSLVDLGHIGADSDTLETLSDEIAAIATAAGQPSLGD